MTKLTYHQIDFKLDFEKYWDDWVSIWLDIWNESNLYKKTGIECNPDKASFKELALSNSLLGIMGLDEKGAVKSGYIGCFGPYIYNPLCIFCEEWLCFVHTEYRTAKEVKTLIKEIDKVMEAYNVALYTFVKPVVESPKDGLSKFGYFQQDTVYMKVRSDGIQ